MGLPQPGAAGSVPAAAQQGTFAAQEPEPELEPPALDLVLSDVSGECPMI